MLRIEPAFEPPSLQWGYTARPEWSSRDESLWIRLSKFSLCNRLSVTQLRRLFTTCPDGTSVDLLRSAGWDTDQLATVLAIEPEQVRSALFDVGPEFRRRCVHALRYCARCLAGGFHPAWFQWRVIERCPLHRESLRTGCPNCSQRIAYELDSAMASSPLRCQHCALPWVPTLFARAGRCVRLERQQQRIIGRWTRQISDLASRRSAFGPVVRDLSGRFALNRALPPMHVLTLVNRHFDAPPPTVGELLARPLVPTHTFAAPEAPHTGFQQRGWLSVWRHFRAFFLTCESLVLAARSSVIATRLRNELASYRSIVGTTLCVPADRLLPAEAAALGWLISWTTATDALTDVGAEESTRMPSLGLAGWLAHLPVQPSSMKSHAWHLQVLQWLRDDLSLSGDLWLQLARFMQAKGHYVLRTPIALPVALACRHD